MKSANSCLSLSWTRAARNAAPSSSPPIIGSSWSSSNAAQPLRDARIFLREFGRLFAQDCELLIVELEKFPVHVLQPIDLDLAGIELHLRDELDGDVDRLHP